MDPETKPVEPDAPGRSDEAKDPDREGGVGPPTDKPGKGPEGGDMPDTAPTESGDDDGQEGA